MANFRFNTQGNNNQQSADDSWKAQGFINLYLPTKGGGKRKLGTIALKDSKPAEKNLLDWLKADDTEGTRMKQLVNAIEFNFQTAEASEASMFDIGAKTGTNG